MKQNYRLLCLSLVLLLSSYAGKILAQSTTYSYTGTVQTYTAGPGVISIGVDCRGAQGGSYPSFGVGGSGGRVQCTLAVTPGELLYVYVGQVGTDGACCGGPIPAGGLNSGGGANGGNGSNSDGGSAGGAASDVRLISGNTFAALNSRLVTAGGGGGGAFDCSSDNGGSGGNTTGGLGTDCSTYTAAFEGGPGTPTAGGAAGSSGASSGTPGGFGFGGNAYPTYFGGGGGGGWYGAGGAYKGGGCGGSSSTGTGATSVTMTTGYQTGNGEVIIHVICAVPTGGAIVGASSVCVGATTTLTDPTGTIGGTWTNGNPLIDLVDPVTGVVTGLSPGVDTITYSITLSCGSATVTRAITVNPLPSPIFGSMGLCPGSTTTLYDTTAGGTWSSTIPAVATAGSATGIVTGISSGYGTISYTLTSTGCAATAVVTVVALSGATHTVCATDSILITATAPSGTWSTSNTSIATVDATGEVTGIAMGTAMVIYTLPSGCSTTWALTVNPLALIAGTDSVCIGANRYLTDIVGGGTWSSNDITTATVTSDSGRVYGVAAGITTITYILPTGCMTTAPFQVIPYPPAILGAMIACPLTTTALTDASAGGWWTSGNTGVATVDSATGIVTGVAADTADIYYTVAPGCTIQMTITINPLPAPITGRDVICPGNKDTLSDITPYGGWSSITPTLTVVDSFGVVTALLASGNAIIQYTLPITGCYQTKIVTIDPLPVPAITYNWIDATLYATTGYAHYQWYDSTVGLIPGAISSSIAASTDTWYFVVVTDSNGCKGASLPFHYDLSMVGVKNISNGATTRIYPNPANDKVNIQSTIPVDAIIETMDGKKLIEQKKTSEVDIHMLPAGIYVISLYDENGVRVSVQKLIKE